MPSFNFLLLCFYLLLSYYPLTLDITQLVDIIVEATLGGFFKADFVTNTGSIIPALNILTILPVLTSIP